MPGTNNSLSINQLLENSKIFYTISIGLDGRYSYVSENYDRNFEFENLTLLGRHFSVTLHPDDIIICEQVGRQCLTEPGQIFSALLRKHDGHSGFVTTQWEMQGQFDSKGFPTGVFCIGYNVSDFVHTKTKLSSATSQLDGIGFIQSHLVRKPLANIVGLTELISNASLKTDIDELCVMLQRSAAELDNVIKNITQRSEEH